MDSHQGFIKNPFSILTILQNSTEKHLLIFAYFFKFIISNKNRKFLNLSKFYSEFWWCDATLNHEPRSIHGCNQYTSLFISINKYLFLFCFTPPIHSPSLNEFEWMSAFIFIWVAFIGTWQYHAYYQKCVEWKIIINKHNYISKTTLTLLFSLLFFCFSCLKMSRLLKHVQTMLNIDCIFWDDFVTGL